MTAANRLGEEDRWFWPRVDRSGSGCWPWTGTVDKHGYGVVKVEGRQRRAHCVALGLPEQDVLHRCGSRLCCRPESEHLYLGDDAQNAQDRDRHGRTARLFGEANPAARLDAAAVAAIRAGGPARELAARFGISVRHVYKVRSGARWYAVVR